uniref:Cation channel sperm associated 4 n=1 Tax=Terrapene triunguis TaxID=2587831 RepID=A0A674J9D7_9SAUR
MLAVWNRKDAMPSGNGEGLPICLSMQDNWDVEEFVSKVCMGRFLNHPAFKITLAALIIGNALIIASRTETKVEEKYYGLFSAIDNIVLTVLTCEVLLNWYYGFRMYWKDGWNVVNFFIVAYLCVGPFIPVLNNQKIFWVLRVMRLMQVCTLVNGLARMIRVILQSIPDMANIMALLFVIMLVRQSSPLGGARYKTGVLPPSFPFHFPSSPLCLSSSPFVPLPPVPFPSTVGLVTNSGGSWLVCERHQRAFIVTWRSKREIHRRCLPLCPRGALPLLHPQAPPLLHPFPQAPPTSSHPVPSHPLFPPSASCMPRNS